MNLEQLIDDLKTFSSNQELTERIAQIESDLRHKNTKNITAYLDKNHVQTSTLQSALTVKELSKQIHVIIHTLGILIALQYILYPDEEIQSLSLGAGNTGKDFDLETDKRIAEFKFIDWQGGAEAIRQNSVFIDLFNLAEYRTNKEKYLYVLNKKIPLRFLNGNRAIKSVLSKNRAIYDKFLNLYKNKYSRVSEYYDDVKDIVQIVDLSGIIPILKR